ncbi:MAG TPA: GNAT family N-acyltransferase [Candidatus Polarisedimenticolia bacterium]|nr:GNAT family N-acyltransferase [Candidatus Polarisedimenticolia bacterium]
MIHPFTLPNPFTDPPRRVLMSLVQPALEGILALPTLNKLYAGLPGEDDRRHFSEKALEALGVGYGIPTEDLAEIPKSGPLIVVANHPFGGLDGLILLALLRRIRPDVRLLGNHLLRAIPDLRDSLIYVDPFGGSDAAAGNVVAVRKALRWVRDGGALGVFPAGEVSHADLRRRTVSDPPWSVAAGRFIQASRAPVISVFFEGRNSPLFHALGLLHPRLRTALLPRELLNHRGTTIRVRVGRVIPSSRLEGFSDPEDVSSYLRLRTYILNTSARSGLPPAPKVDSPVAEGGEDIIAAVPRTALAEEVAGLPAGQLLLQSGPFLVAYARAGQIPETLREIGRLREISFRKVGEGTGRALDLDRFDEYYLHLFVWNRETSEVVGAYRMGPTDEILPRFGKDGLYTSTLFKYRDRLLAELGPALEMGRSFIRPEYQKNHSPLTLLWKGIGRYVAAHPRYRRLFGPVSISAEYQSMSRQLLIAFLRMNRYVSELGRLIHPRNRPRLAPIRDWDPRLAGTVVKDLEDVDSLIREIETDHKSMPILLRQYLRLNGVLLGFNVDPEFGNVLDGLILVDLVNVDRMILSRYMGREGLDAFLAWQADRGTAAQSASSGTELRR